MPSVQSPPKRRQLAIWYSYTAAGTGLYDPPSRSDYSDLARFAVINRTLIVWLALRRHDGDK